MPKTLKLQDLADQYPHPAILVHLVSLKPEIVSSNEAFCQLCHSTKEKIRGRNLFELEFFKEIVSKSLITEKLGDAAERVLECKRSEKAYFTTNHHDETTNSEDVRIWLMEISPLKGYSENDHLLLGLHDISGLSDEKEICEHLGSEKEEKAKRKELEQEILDSDTQNKAVIKELDNFMYSVSHDLRAPLRRIDGFSQELINEYAEELDDRGGHYLQRIRKGAQDMGVLIDELLKLSRLSRRSVSRKQVDIGNIAKEVFNELYELETERNISMSVDGNMEANADPGLVKVLFTNLLSNAFKFTQNVQNAEIQLGKQEGESSKFFFIRDNGAGFDPDHSDMLFKAFSRLHSQKIFSGSGIGLATVKRIVSLHGGDIRGEGEVGKGAVFYFNFE